MLHLPGNQHLKAHAAPGTCDTTPGHQLKLQRLVMSGRPHHGKRARSHTRLALRPAAAGSSTSIGSSSNTAGSSSSHALRTEGGTEGGTQEGGTEAGGDAATDMGPFRLRISGRSISTTSAGRSSHARISRTSRHTSEESEHVARASSYLGGAFEDPPEEGVDYPEEDALTSPRRLSIGQAVSSPILGHENEHVARASSYLADAFEDPPEEGVDYPEEDALTSPFSRRLSIGQAVSSPRSGV